MLLEAVGAGLEFRAHMLRCMRLRRWVKRKVQVTGSDVSVLCWNLTTSEGSRWSLLLLCLFSVP